MKATILKKKYLEFFQSKNHKIIYSAPLVPENDPSVLFTTAGMHPLVPFLLGQKHPLGNRLADVQKCLRTGDIDEVGDETHTTFFEMLGNWSFGDYFKKEAITWSYEFLTSKDWLGLDKNRISVTCFKGDSDAPRDDESADIWKSLGISENRIAFLDKEENWWPAGGKHPGPQGPDTEIFYWRYNNVKPPEKFDPEDKGWVEIWNNVFMQYERKKDGSYIPLKQKNVDTGMGVERTSMVLQGFTNIYQTELFAPIINLIEDISGVKFDDNNKENMKSFRIIADHMRASTFILGDERDVTPSNLDQGYILRRYIRRSIRHLRKLNPEIDLNTCEKISKLIIEMYKKDYPLLEKKYDFIVNELKKEQNKFNKTLETGLKEFNRITEKMLEHNQTKISGKVAFLLFQSYGFPIEIIQELAQEKNMIIDLEGYDKAYKKHQEASKKGSENKFKGGLANNDYMSVRLHTATHILNQALKKVLDNPNIVQKGSNITTERLRFDFNFDRKLTDVEKKAIEDEVNRVINMKLNIKREEMKLDDALKLGAQAEFGTRYPEIVSVYSIDDYSKEICMGPHVRNTSELGHFKIKKEQSSASGVRRIKAVLE